MFRNKEPPFELKTARILAAAQVYDPTLMISEFTGPLTIASRAMRRISSPTGS